MSTHTPNLNLYKPDATDPVSEFRAEFNNNMDKIDSGGGGGSSSLAGLSDVTLSSPSNNQVLKYNSTSQKWENQNESGGGSGGHTIYDPNGTAMTQRSGLQFTGNASVTDDSGNDKTVINISGGGGSGGAIYMGAQLLWSGSFSGTGTIDVPNLSDYLVIAVQNDVSVLVIGNTFTGNGALGIYGQAQIGEFAYRFDNSVANKLTVNANNRGIIYYNGSNTYQGGTWCTITKIYGLVKKTGANQYYDFAIDPNNKLYEGSITNFNQQMEYTATEDAMVLCWYYGNAGYQHLYINGEPLVIYGDAANKEVSFAVPIKKGDVVASRYLTTSQSCYFRMVVYGIRQGTKVVAQNFSETETVIGTFCGKPLYQQCIPFSGITIYANTGYAFNISSYIQNYKTLFPQWDMSYYFVSGVQRSFTGITVEPPNVILVVPVTRTNISGHLVMRYTKTTD